MSSAEATLFAPPSGAEVVVITHILELPRYLPVKDSQAMVLYEEREDVFVDWPDEVKAHLALAPAPPQSGRSPALRLVFRQILTRTRLPLEAADRAFADWVRPLVPQPEWRSRQRQLKKASRRGFWEPTTVVAATRFVAASTWPPREVDQMNLLLGELLASLDLINALSLSVGLVTEEPRLLPIALGDLPALCPFIIEAAPMAAGRRSGVSAIYPIHEDLPAIREMPLGDEPTQAAVEIARSGYYGEQPFFLFYELLQAARAAAVSRRHAAAIAAVGTAVEVLVSAVIRNVSFIRGEPAMRAQSILNAGLRNVVVDHFPRYANTAVDLADPANPFGCWWLNGYETRNAVVHEGHRPNSAEVEEALTQAVDLVRAIRDGLIGDPATEPLGNLLTIIANEAG